ncbi:MAG: helix-turn-helix domain-containing protein [Nitrosopumilaceae archaeon]
MKVEMLFGGKTRFAILEALTDARQPLTAYQVAMARGLDPAATYRCLAELLEFGIVKSKAERNQTFYGLSDVAGKAAAEFLRSLKQKTPESVDLEKWMSLEMRSKRMEKIIRLEQADTLKFENSGKKQNIDDLLSKRIPGELSVLIVSSKIAFDELFEQKDGTFILKVR